MTTAPQLKQVYKNRAEAYRLFIQAQSLPVGQTKFYNDAERLGLISQDKSIELAALLIYVKTELQIDPTSGQSLVEKEKQATLEDLELRKLKAETERKERENEDGQKESDKKWLHRDVAEEALAALVGTLQDALDHQFYVGSPEIIHHCGGDSRRVEDVYIRAKALISNAFMEVLDEGHIDGVFSAEEEIDHE